MAKTTKKNETPKTPKVKDPVFKTEAEAVAYASTLPRGTYSLNIAGRSEKLVVVRCQ